MAAPTLTAPAAEASPLAGIDPPLRQTGSTVLALDLGTTVGWALRMGNHSILSGTQTFRPGRFEGGGMRYLRFTDWLIEIAMRAHGLRRVVFEEVRRHAGTDAAHVYGGFLGTLTAWCEEHEIPYQGVPVGTITRFIELDAYTWANNTVRVMARNISPTATFDLSPATLSVAVTKRRIP